MKRKRLIPLGLLAILVTVLIIAFSGGESTGSNSILIEVKAGEFIVDVTTSGELEAKNSVKILGPSGLRNYRIWNVSIQDIIEEGTYVEKGQYVAGLSHLQGSVQLCLCELGFNFFQLQFCFTHLVSKL
jgi:hypothetical protein